MSNSLKIALPLNSKRAWETPMIAQLDGSESDSGHHGTKIEFYNATPNDHINCAAPIHATRVYTMAGNTATAYSKSSKCPVPTAS
jgi:hypothetical protein